MPGAAHILLIEDDASLAANLCDVLKGEGFQVTVCSRGDEGLRRASHGECEVVLTDLRLPGLGGLELVRQDRKSTRLNSSHLGISYISPLPLPGALPIPAAMKDCAAPATASARWC